jgi:hypothetical protein
MIFRKPKEEREKTRVEKRVATLPTAELITWCDQIIYSIGRNLSSWQKTQDNYSLNEAHMGAEALYAITSALKERSIK